VAVMSAPLAFRRIYSVRPSNPEVNARTPARTWPVDMEAARTPVDLGAGRSIRCPCVRGQ